MRMHRRHFTVHFLSHYKRALTKCFKPESSDYGCTQRGAVPEMVELNVIVASPKLYTTGVVGIIVGMEIPWERKCSTKKMNKGCDNNKDASFAMTMNSDSPVIES